MAAVESHGSDASFGFVVLIYAAKFNSCHTETEAVLSHCLYTT
jgi:hypothetical protein